MNKIGLIIGHGFNLSGKIESAKDHFMDSPYGKPSDRFTSGKIGKKEVVVLFRHGNDEKIPSFAINYKANMFVLHEMGCTHIISTSLCGSLQEEICVGEFVVFDQFIDLTKHRELTYSDHIPLAKLNLSAFNKPFSDDIRDCLIEAAVRLGHTVHTKGTVLAVDGPRQSTRAESNLFRKWGADVVNTSTAPEAILAHELGMAYASISLCTYYDTWRTDISPATREEKQEIIDVKGALLKEMVLQALSKC
jgi:5'-methylthioadenosine phosphorylase